MNIGAHPADLIDDAGGTTIIHADRGDRVVAVTLTLGTRVHDKVLDELRKEQQVPDKADMVALFEQRAQTKRQEVIDACRLLGVNEVHFLTYDEQFMSVTEKLVLELAALIRDVRPDIVVTHFPLDGGGIACDHATTGKITMHAIRAAAGIQPGDRNPQHRVAQVFFRGISSVMTRADVLSSQPHMFCDVYVDISDVIDRKVRAIDQLSSQNYTGPVTRKMLETYDGILGTAVGVAYAESFMRHHPVVYGALPLEDFTRQRAAETEKEFIDRSSRMWVHALPVTPRGAPTDNAQPTKEG